jgi:hypothetical protein
VTGVREKEKTLVKVGGWKTYGQDWLGEEDGVQEICAVWSISDCLERYEMRLAKTCQVSGVGCTQIFRNRVPGAS